MARPGFEPRTSRIPCEHSDHWATEPHGRPVTISPCLIRFVPESARNHAGTDESVSLLLAARARTHTEPPNVTGEEKAHGPTGIRTQDLSHTVRALWPLSYRATRSTRDMFIINVGLYKEPEFARTKIHQKLKQKHAFYLENTKIVQSVCTEVLRFEKNTSWKRISYWNQCIFCSSSYQIQVDPWDKLLVMFFYQKFRNFNFCLKMLTT